MSKRRSKAPSQRQLRVGEELRHILAHALERGQLNDPLIQDVLITKFEILLTVVPRTFATWHDS